MKFKTTRTMMINTLLICLVSLFSFCKKDASHTPANNTQYTQYGTPFAGVPNTADAIIYQVNIRAFSNDASLKGVTARLDSIKALGVNVVYLMPVYPVGALKSAGGLGSPYAVKNYKAVNSEFGNMDDLKALVDAAHSKNMAVMLDWVADHTSWDNAWISNKSWYKQDASGNIIPPTGTNWTDVAALNFDNQDMRKAMIDAMEYWVYNANIDGFRCDAADFVPFDFWKQANDALKTISTHKLLMLAEGTRGDHFKAGFQMTYGMAWYSTIESKVYAGNGSVTQLSALNTSEYSGAFNGSQVVRYITNHDVYNSDGNPIALYGGKIGSMAAFLVSAYMKGVPMIYNGQEVGCTRGIDFFYHTPIDWGTNPDMTAEYKKIIAFRKNSDAVRNGDLATFSSDDVAVFAKSTSKEKVLVISNLKNNTVAYTVPAGLNTTSWKNAFTGASVSLNGTLALQPYQHMVLTQ